MRTLLRRVWHWARRGRREAELAEELAFHREMTERELARRGHPPDDIRPAASRALGSVTLARERSREVWVSARLESLTYDLRFALRGLLRERSFTLTAITIFSLAIALNVVAFTIMDAMLFRGLPLATRSDRLVYLHMRRPTDVPCCPGPVSFADLEIWRAQASAFTGLALQHTGLARAPLRDAAGRSLDVDLQRVSANTFQLLGVRPILGRDFAAADEAPTGAHVAIISHRLWERRFAARGDAVGATVSINNVATTIIGVMPEGFALVSHYDLWLPIRPAAGLEGTVIGRLRDGATLEEARAQIETITRRLHAADPARRHDVPQVATYAQSYLAPDGPMIYGSLWVGACFVLVIACANLANLAMVRTLGRWREFSTRIALGGGLWRMGRQIVLEHLMLATVAGTLAWWITRWSLQVWASATSSRYLAIDYAVFTGGERSSQVLFAGADYFRVMGAAPVTGRTFTDSDDRSEPLVAVVNQRFVDTFLPNAHPIGRRFRTIVRETPGPWRTVVGVVPNIMQGDPTRQSFKPIVYAPARQTPTGAAFLFARTHIPADQAASAIRTVTRRLDPDVIEEDFSSLTARFAFNRDYMDLEHAELGKHAAVAPVLAVIALLLSAVGLFAVVAHSVAQRTKEIGIRMAIGARAPDVRRMILSEGMAPVWIGVVAGLAASVAVNRALQSQLVGVSPYDPLTMAGAPFALMVIALVACEVPARRALNVDPIVALRHD